ncbi:MAG: Nif11-like leader peptide family RiPP precursor [Arcobacteraceae bacterium]
MTQSNIEKFMSDAEKNKELQAELKAMGNDIEKITHCANAKGYAFSVSDFKSFIETNKDELSDEELESVAGGVTFIPSNISFA